MADIIDKANDLQSHFDEMQIKQIRQQAKRRDAQAVGVGYCLNCGEEINESDRRWCNAECRDDWEKLNNKGI